METIAARWVLALATTPPPPEAPVPYPTPLFYAPAPLVPGRPPILVFASRADTCHGRHLGEGPTPAAAAIYLESEVVGELRGVQLRGDVTVCTRLRGGLAEECRDAYIQRHPGAAARLGPDSPERLYGLALRWAKLTDNRLGFGVRLQWTFPALEPAWGGAATG